MKRILKYSGLSLLGIIILVLLLPFLFPGVVTKKVKAWANRSINAELDFNRPRFSFFEHFPALTLTLHDFTLKGSKPFEQDTLIEASALAFGFDLSSLLSRKLRIDEIYLKDGSIKILTDSLGHPNYNVYVPDSRQQKTDNPASDTSSTDLKIEKIRLENMQLVYDDRSLNVLATAKNITLNGDGDMTRETFGLRTVLHIGSFNLSYGGTTWLQDKRVELDLLTQVDTRTLAFQLDRTDLKLNTLPLQVNGLFSFLHNGYRMDLRLRTNHAGLDDLLNAFPPEMMEWVHKTKAAGQFDLDAKLTGDYVTDKSMPSLSVTCALRNGQLAYQGAPKALSSINVKAAVSSPSLTPDSTRIQMDTLGFLMDKDRFFAALDMTGIRNPLVKARLETDIDLGSWQQAVGMAGIKLGGRLNVHAMADGRYATIGNKIKSIPSFNIKGLMREGSFQRQGVDVPVEGIWIDLNASCPDNNYRHITLDLDSLRARLIGDSLHGHLHLKDIENIRYDIGLDGTINLGKWGKAFALDAYDLGGTIESHLLMRGTKADAETKHYDRLYNKGSLKLRNVNVKASMFPLPFVIRQGDFHFEQDNMVFDAFKARYGKSDIGLDGRLENLIAWVTSAGKPLQGHFTFTSDQLVLDEFRTAATPPTEQLPKPAASSGVVLLPRDVDIQLEASVKQASYEGLVLQDVKGGIGLQQGKAVLNDLSFDAVGTKVQMNGSYEGLSPKRAVFDYKIKATDFDVKKAYKQVDMFRELAPSAANAEGIISLDYAIAGKLNENLDPIMPSLKGEGVLSVKQVRLKGFKLMNAVSGNTGKDALRDPDLSKVEIRSRISNNLMTIDRVKMKVAGFRPRFEGQISLDGKLFLKGRVGLPPFGIFGIPFTVTGTQSDPKVQVRKAKEGDKLEETQEDGEND